jgi:hypothetical protein
MLLAGREIKRIIASGCSFTYGEGLSDPNTESWPAQLAHMLDVECVNLAWKGMGNEWVQRTIMDYLCQNPDHRKDSLVIPCFTMFHRVEFTSRARINHKNYEWTTMPNGRIHFEMNRLFFNELFVQDYYYARYIRIIISLQCMLAQWDVPYLMFEGLSGNPHQDMIDKPEIEPLMAAIDRTKWLRFTLGNLDTMTDPDERLPDGHPNANAYKQMAEILHKHLINNYALEQE